MIDFFLIILMSIQLHLMLQALSKNHKQLSHTDIRT